MAKIICNVSKGSCAKCGDFVYIESNGWGIVGYGGAERGNCVYYLNGGYDMLKLVNVEKVIDNDSMIITLDTINS